MPSQFSSSCGFFYEITTTLFGIIDIQKIWVVLHNHIIKIYSNKFSCDSSGMKREIDRKFISKVRDKKLRTSNPKINNFGGIEIILSSEFSNEILTLAWSEDTAKLKGMWKRCLAPVVPGDIVVDDC